MMNMEMLLEQVQVQRELYCWSSVAEGATSVTLAGMTVMLKWLV